jgi:hypothetical protein
MTRRRPSSRTARRAAGTTVALGVLGLFGQLLGLIGTLGAAGLTLRAGPRWRSSSTAGTWPS